jgi:phage baseplate assembly protein W
VTTGPRYVAFPLRATSGGGTATASYAEHVEQLLEQLLFTSPGERVNRPALGCGLADLVFGTLTDELVTATQFLVQANLQGALGDVARIDAVRVRAAGDDLTVTVTYALLITGESRTMVFPR